MIILREKKIYTSRRVEGSVSTMICIVLSRTTLIWSTMWLASPSLVRLTKRTRWTWCVGVLWFEYSLVRFAPWSSWRSSCCWLEMVFGLVSGCFLSLSRILGLCVGVGKEVILSEWVIWRRDFGMVGSFFLERRVWWWMDKGGGLIWKDIWKDIWNDFCIFCVGT